MPTDPATLALLCALVLFAAVLYSSVGHAGASAYLAAMSLFGVPPGQMKPAALVMNILVALVGTWRFTSARLVLPDRPGARRPPPAAPWLVLIGAGFGFVAGLTGVGGGIFLSPLFILAGWADPRTTAGASVVFILVNSIAGLAGYLLGNNAIPPATGLLAAVAVAGGLYGSWLGSRRLAPLTLRRLLSGVLIIAGLKLLLTV